MTVSSTQSYIEYNADGVTTTFTIPFYFLLNSDISVMIADSAGNISEPVNGTNFTATGAGDSGGGSVTFNTAYASGNTILIYRNPPATQETKYYENGKFPAASHEAALDKLTMLIQEYDWRFDSLTLKKPSVFSSYFDALTNRISNLGEPAESSDAVTKSYADAVGAGSKSYTDSQVAAEAAQREAADNLERDARAEADAKIQEQLTGNIPLSASAFSVISWHDQRIENSITIPDNKNAWSIGQQMAIAPGQVVTVGENSSYTIADGREVEDEDLHNLIADTLTTTNGSKTVTVSEIATESDVGGLQTQVAELADRMTDEEEKINDIDHGGTGAKTAAAARSALGAKANAGVTDASNASAGVTGEYLSATASSVSLATGVTTNITSLALTAGDWDISGVTQFDITAAPTALSTGSTITSATSQGFPNNNSLNATFAAGTQRLLIPSRRLNVSATTTVYVIASATFSSGTATASAFISARRIR